MPWTIAKGGGTCTDSQWAVLNADTGRTVGCHASKRKAQAQLAALNANVDEAASWEPVELVSFLEADRKLQKRRGTRTIEEQGTAKVASAFDHERRRFIGELGKLRPEFVEARRQLREAPGEDRWGPAWERASGQVRAEFREALDWIARAGLTAGGKALIAHLALEGVSFDLDNPRAVAWIAEHGAERVAGIDATTRDYLRAVLREAVDKGWTYTRTARAIVARFAEFSAPSPLAHIRSRAELIAVTETASAYEAGNRIAVETMRANLPAGIGVEKAWLTVGDERVDEEACAPNEAEGWIPVDESHNSGHGEPPAHPGCRCTEMYQTVRLGQ